MDKSQAEAYIAGYLSSKVVHPDFMGKVAFTDSIFGLELTVEVEPNDSGCPDITVDVVCDTDELETYAIRNMAMHAFGMLLNARVTEEPGLPYGAWYEKGTVNVNAYFELIALTPTRPDCLTQTQVRMNGQLFDLFLYKSGMHQYRGADMVMHTISMPIAHLPPKFIKAAITALGRARMYHWRR